MKNPSLILLGLITIFVTLLPNYLNGQGEVPVIQIDVQKKVLENGVTILVWERPSAGRIGTRMFYKVDVAAERPGTVGLTHMLEHHLFKGSDIAGTSNWIEEHPVAIQVERLAREVIDEENRNWDCHLQRDIFEEKYKMLSHIQHGTIGRFSQPVVQILPHRRVVIG